MRVFEWEELCWIIGYYDFSFSISLVRYFFIYRYLFVDLVVVYERVYFGRIFWRVFYSFVLFDEGYDFGVFYFLFKLELSLYVSK